MERPYVIRLLLFIIGLCGVAASFVVFSSHWPKLLLGVCIAFLVLAPQILGAVIDPIAAWRIERQLRPLGAANVRVHLFPNHYGVHFDLSGRHYYLKCSLKKGKLKWRGKSPASVAQEVGAVLPNTSLERTREG